MSCECCGSTEHEVVWACVEGMESEFCSQCLRDLRRAGLEVELIDA